MRISDDMAEFLAWMAAACCVIALIMIVLACNVDGDHDVKVRGGTKNEVTVGEDFCDAETYPTTAERRACKDQLLAAMKCRDE
jgi:hypothetical protein